MKIAFHAGHANPGGLGQGAVGIMNESAEARKVIAALKDICNYNNICYYNCTVYRAMNQNDVLKAVTLAHNNAEADVNISVHLNSASNPRANGCEAIYYPGNSEMHDLGYEIVEKIHKYTNIAMRNKPVYAKDNLYIMKNIKGPLVLIECAFVSSALDASLWDPEKVAFAIFEAVCEHYNVTLVNKEPTEIPSEEASKVLYKVQTGAFAKRENAEKQLEKMKKAGFDGYIKEERK